MTVVHLIHQLQPQRALARHHVKILNAVLSAAETGVTACRQFKKE